MTTQSSTYKQWYEIVKESENQAGVNFDEVIESYVILTLDEYMLDLSLMENSMAIELLKSLKLNSNRSVQQLRKVGDHCLLIAGLFPERAQKLISIGYYVDIGQQAYFTLSDQLNLSLDPKLFQKLGIHFVEIKDVLNAMRTIAEKRILN